MATRRNTFDYTFRVRRSVAKTISDDWQGLYHSRHPLFDDELIEGMAATLELIHKYGRRFNEGLLGHCARYMQPPTVEWFVTERIGGLSPWGGDEYREGNLHLGVKLITSDAERQQFRALLSYLQARPTVTPGVLRAVALLAMGHRASAIEEAIDVQLEQLAEKRLS